MGSFIAFEEGMEVNGGTIMAVVDEVFTRMDIGYIKKNEVDSLEQLFDIVRNMSETEYQATLKLFKRTAR